MSIRINGLRPRGTRGILINGVEVVVEGGSGGGSTFYNITSDPPDITPGLPDNTRLTFASDIPAHALSDVPDVPGSTTQPSPLWGTSLPTHAVYDIPEYLPVADVTTLAYGLPSNVLYYLYDSPIEDVADLTTALPTPVL